MRHRRRGIYSISGKRAGLGLYRQECFLATAGAARSTGLPDATQSLDQGNAESGNPQ